MTSPILRSPALWLASPVAAVSALLWLACGPSAPFGLGPPPTFAVHYQWGGGPLYYPAAAGTGSTLYGEYYFDIVGAGYTPKGSTKQFGPTPISFGTYYVVDDGRFPARWNIVSVAGCGAMSDYTADVTEKILNVYCYPAVGYAGVDPSNYDAIDPPGSLTIQFYDMPDGTPADLYVVTDSGGVESAEGVYIYGNTAYVSSVPGSCGHYYLAADLYTHPNDFEAASGEFTAYGC